jgi:hypothetical protein
MAAAPSQLTDGLSFPISPGLDFQAFGGRKGILSRDRHRWECGQAASSPKRPRLYFPAKSFFDPAAHHLKFLPEKMLSTVCDALRLDDERAAKEEKPRARAMLSSRCSNSTSGLGDADVDWVSFDLSVQLIRAAALVSLPKCARQAPASMPPNWPRKLSRENLRRGRLNRIGARGRIKG